MNEKSNTQKPLLNDGVWEFIQMATGVSLVLFMCAHMMLVASVNLDWGVGHYMDIIAEFFEKTYMAQIGGPFIFLVMLAHFVAAARKIPYRIGQQKTIVKHAARMDHLDTKLWIVQATTAFIILVFASIHIWTVLTNMPLTAARSGARIQTGWWLLLYGVLMPCVELHIGVGAYRIGVKWGLIKRSNRMFFSGFEKIWTTLF